MGVPAESRQLGAWSAVLIGHLLITGPALIVMAAFLFGGASVGHPLVGLLAGGALGWTLWSFTIPRWRRWAIRRGAPPERLQRIAASTLLVWPKGWVFEKTEARLDDARDDEPAPDGSWSVPRPAERGSKTGPSEPPPYGG
jgi:hypothetical protein